jgi:coenzyme Q-binding protein COQ10
MSHLKEKKFLPYSAKKMFDLVMDIEKYPEFLPWCKNAKIIEKISNQNIHAELLINFKSFFEKYTSDVQFGFMPDDAYFIDVVAIKGPFKTLINKWKFTKIDLDRCEIEFFIEFEFNSNLLTKMIGLVFGKAVEKMVNAFEERAYQLYGKSNPNLQNF